MVIPVRVPGVALAVSVVVAQVVGLPGQRRHDDRDAVLAEPARAEHERREADQPFDASDARSRRRLASFRSRRTKRRPARTLPTQTRPVTARPCVTSYVLVGWPSGPERRICSVTPLAGLKKTSEAVSPARVALLRKGGLDSRLELLRGRRTAFELLRVERPARCGDERERSAAIESAMTARTVRREAPRLYVRCKGGHAPTVGRGPNRSVMAISRVANGPIRRVSGVLLRASIVRRPGQLA